jgi:hypothetical protein
LFIDWNAFISSLKSLNKYKIEYTRFLSYVIEVMERFGRLEICDVLLDLKVECCDYWITNLYKQIYLN